MNEFHRPIYDEEKGFKAVVVLEFAEKMLTESQRESLANLSRATRAISEERGLASVPPDQIPAEQRISIFNEAIDRVPEETLDALSALIVNIKYLDSAGGDQ